MDYYDKQRAKVNIARELERRGWKLYGYTPDQSDLMTDYYAPATWDGIAEKNGYVVAVDISPYIVETRSGQVETHTYPVEVGICKHCGGTGQEPDGWTLEAARANPREYNRQTSPPGTVPVFPDIVSPIGFKNGRQKCTKCGESGKVYEYKTEVVATWPTFQANPGRCSWHVEKAGMILAKGVGLNKCHISNSHMEPYKSELAANMKAFVDRIEAAMTSASPPSPPVVGGVTVTENEEKDGIEIRFNSKPGAETLAQVRAQGFQWHRRGMFWYAKRTPERIAFARSIVAQA